jgi:hypothetical protein
MQIVNIYSKRQKQLNGETPDILDYNDMSMKLRVQVVQIIKKALGRDQYAHEQIVSDVFEYINQVLCQEYGVFRLSEKLSVTAYEGQVINQILKSIHIEKVLDVIELVFSYIDTKVRDDFDSYSYATNPELNPDQAIQDLNQRFKENGFGYSFVSGQIIRIDSTYIHSEVVIPTLILLMNSKFSSANEEYLLAHEHYKAGRNKECLVECLKSFESVLKVICDENNWGYSQTDTAKKLIQICFHNHLVPSFMQTQYNSLQSLLESGVPTVRNKIGGHGQGTLTQKADDEITRLALNLTGTNIIYLVEQSRIK